MPGKLWGEITFPFLNFKCNRWSLGMDKQFHPTFYNGCNYLSMLGLRLYHVSERGPMSLVQAVNSFFIQLSHGSLFLGIELIFKCWCPGPRQALTFHILSKVQGKSLVLCADYVFDGPPKQNSRWFTTGGLAPVAVDEMTDHIADQNIPILADIVAVFLDVNFNLASISHTL